MLAFLSRSRKTITAALVPAIAWYTAAVVPDGHVTRIEWLALVLAEATAFGVYNIPNVLTDQQVAEHLATHPLPDTAAAVAFASNFPTQPATSGLADDAAPTVPPPATPTPADVAPEPAGAST